MKEYEEIQVTKKVLKSITCNKCGKSKEITDFGFEQDEFHSLNLSFGYGSGFDEERWKFDLCESCLVDFVKTFKYSPTIINI